MKEFRPPYISVSKWIFSQAWVEVEELDAGRKSPKIQDSSCWYVVLMFPEVLSMPILQRIVIVFVPLDWYEFPSLFINVFSKEYYLCSYLWIGMSFPCYCLGCLCEFRMNLFPSLNWIKLAWCRTQNSEDPGFVLSIGCPFIPRISLSLYLRRGAFVFVSLEDGYKFS